MEFKIRPWEIDDLNNLVKYANNFNIAKNLTDKFPYPYTITDGEKFIEFASLDNPKHIFAIEINGEAVGGIGIHPQTDILKKNAELGFWIGEPFWGQKVISKAISQIIDFGFSNYEIDRIFARAFGENIASQKVLEKNNFILEAKFEKILFKNDEYIDELVFAFRREKWKGGREGKISIN